MNETHIIVRAIGAEYVRRFLKPVAIAISLFFVSLLIFGTWLTTISAWWWLLQIVFIGLALAVISVMLIIRFLIGFTDTAQTPEQKQAVNNYVDKIERVTDTIQTPQPIILFRVIKDIIRPSQNGIIQTMSHDTKSLAPDYTVLKRNF